jgi:hypothetical protein
MTSAARSDWVVRRARRTRFAIGSAITEAKRVARRHPVLLAAAVLVLGGGGAAGAAAVSQRSSDPVPPWVLADCGRGVSGPGFRVFACDSGGAAAGHPHPKELLVLRNDGSSVAYPGWGGQGVAAGDGEVVAFHDLNVVRVTRSRLVAIVTAGELARALHVRPTAIVWPMNDLRVDARGDVYFAPSVQIRRSGCRNPLVERTAGGTIREIRASITRSNVCQ